MSENDELARRLAEEQARADKEALDEVTQKIEAGFRLATQEEQQRQADRHEREQKEQQATQQAQAQEAAHNKAQEYEAENRQKAQEAGQEIAGNVKEQPFGYANNAQTADAAYTTDNYASQDTAMPSYEGPAAQHGDGTTIGSAAMNGQTDTYDVNVQNTNSRAQENPQTGLQIIQDDTPRTNENLSITPYSEARQFDARQFNANINQPRQTSTATQTEVDYNDPFAAWHAENQMRSATFDMNQSEQAMFDDQLNTVTPDSYSVGAAEPAMMGSFTQDLSDDDRILYKTIRTANTDETGPVQVGPAPATHSGNTQEGTTPANAKDADDDNRIYVNDQTFAARFDDTIFWKSDERKKAWEQFVNGFKNAKTLEDLIENGLWASLEIGLDMINAYMDWEASEAKKLAAFIKESKKTYDSDQMKASGISPQEAIKRTHDGIHASKDFWKALEQQKFYGNLPRNEHGGIDLKNCTNEQKAMLGEFQVRFAQSSPEFKKAMENMLGREFNGEDLMLAAESVRNTLHGYEDGPYGEKGGNVGVVGKGPQGPEPDAPQHNPNTPSPQGPTPITPAPKRVLAKEVPLSLGNETIKAPNRVLETQAPKALENTGNTPNVYRMGPINETKENVVIDGRTGQVLDGVQVPDKETMRNVTPPKGPLKNAKPMEFEDLNKRAADNIRNMHDTADAMRQNAINARLIDMSRNGGRPTPRGRGQNKLLGNNFGRNAA